MTKDRLKIEIRHELGQLQRLAQMATQLAAVPAEQREHWHAAAAAKYIADLTMGLENLWKRRCRFLGDTAPTGPDSHSQMLEQFFAVPELGGQLSHEMRLRLKKYLRFRHRFFHGYAYDVNWQIVDEPLRLLPDTVERLDRAWTVWLETE